MPENDQNIDLSMLDFEGGEGDPQLAELVVAKLNELPSPEFHDRNGWHFMVGNQAVLKAVPWLDPKTGELIAKPPLWTMIFPRTDVVAKADYVQNLPSVKAESGEYVPGVRPLRNPATGEIVERKVPWVETETLGQNGSLILSEYKPGLEVSKGAKRRYKHNPQQEFDDPTDRSNLRFFNWLYIDRSLVHALGPIHWEHERPFDSPEIGAGKRAVIGANLGGTIMMGHGPNGLETEGQIMWKFRDMRDQDPNFKEQFENYEVASFVFPRAKKDKDSDPTYGIDSSQIEIDFIADLAIVLTCAWNDITPEERRAFDGFIVTIGTDTSVEAFTLLKMMLGPNCPFSVIGAAGMDPIDDPGSDSPINFKSAFADLKALKKKGLATVAIRLEGGLYDPTKTKKVSDKKGGSFKGARYKDPKFLTEKGANGFRKISEAELNGKYNETVAFRGADQVKLISPNISVDPFMLEREVKESPAKAILVETYPSFTQASKDFQAILRGALGRPIFYINQIQGGVVGKKYQAAPDLEKYGVSSLNMTGHAARAKLNYAINFFGDDKKMIVDFMTANDFVGEQSPNFMAIRNAQKAQLDAVTYACRDKVSGVFAGNVTVVRILPKDEDAPLVREEGMPIEPEVI